MAIDDDSKDLNPTDGTGSEGTSGSTGDAPIDQEKKSADARKLEEKTKEVKFNFARLFSSLTQFFKATLTIREGTDYKGTIEGIQKDIDFKGPNVWILICSIGIASIGLNVNSAAVVIGAMLISPLMGPILGVGLSIGTNNWEMLKRSMGSFGIAVAVSLITSFIYFSISPLKELQLELLARTKPTILDVLVAIFGGMAGIIAGSRREKSNVVPGVAIATALMPPLCTAGFGLATGNWEFFLGAFYLFFINSGLIAISTLVVVRFLNFPLKEFVDPKRERRIKQYLTVFTLILIIPSAIIFYYVVKESTYRVNATEYIKREILVIPGSWEEKEITYKRTGNSIIKLSLLGEYIDEGEMERLKNKLPHYGLDNTELIIEQFNWNQELMGKFDEKEQQRVKYLEEFYNDNKTMLENKDERISLLEKELISLKKETFPVADIHKEISVNYPEIKKVSYGVAIETNFEAKPDTLCTFIVSWKSDIQSEQIVTKEAQLKKWLQVRLSQDSVRVLSLP